MTAATLAKEPATRVAALVVLLLAAIMPEVVWHQDTSGFLTDDGMNLLLADFFSPYRDTNMLVNHLVVSQSRFPPAFPVVIALLGGGSDNMPAAHLGTGACFLLAAVVFYLWARITTSAPWVVCLCLVAFILLPESLIYTQELRSEFLYLVFVFTAFLLLQFRPESRQRERELLIAAAFVIGLCMLTRTIGVALLAAFLIHLYLQGTRNKPLYIATAALPPACWLAIKSLSGYSETYVSDFAPYLSLDGLWRLLLEDIPRNAMLFFTGWQENLAAGGEAPWVLQALAAALLLLAMVGAGHRAAQRRMDFFYVIVYLLLVLPWPHPDHMTRFVYPLVPIFLVYIVVGARLISSWPAAPGVAAAAVLLLVVPSAASIGQRFLAPFPEHIPEDFRHTRSWLTETDLGEDNHGLEVKHRTVRLLKRVPDTIGKNECIYASHPVITMLYAGLPSTFVPEDMSPGNLRQCRYLFVMNLRASRPARYPLDSIDHDRLLLIDIENDRRGDQQAFLFRITR